MWMHVCIYDYLNREFNWNQERCRQPRIAQICRIHGETGWIFFWKKHLTVQGPFIAVWSQRFGWIATNEISQDRQDASRKPWRHWNLNVYYNIYIYIYYSEIQIDLLLVHILWSSLMQFQIVPYSWYSKHINGETKSQVLSVVDEVISAQIPLFERRLSSHWQGHKYPGSVLDEDFMTSWLGVPKIDGIQYLDEIVHIYIYNYNVLYDSDCNI